ncbi:hypothetical protein [Geodermatophilus sp. SYSU D00079]
MSHRLDTGLRVRVAAASPGGRWSAPQHTARAVAWLGGDEAAWVTGRVAASDGGWSAR